jgi:hypothetical protein
MSSKAPEWTPEQIMAARKVYRRNGSLSDAMEAIGDKFLAKGGCRKRLTALGMRFHDRPSTHLSTSKISDPSYKVHI